MHNAQIIMQNYHSAEKKFGGLKKKIYVCSVK